MAIRPDKLPVWATGTDAEKTEPTTNKREKGWILEKPAYQFFNWWMNLVYNWIKFFKQKQVVHYDTKMPVGGVIAFAGDITKLPGSDTYLVCDGRKINQNDYPNLYENLNWNTDVDGDVILPDLSDRFLYGRAENSKEEKGGSTEKELQAENMAFHKHSTEVTFTMHKRDIGDIGVSDLKDTGDSKKYVSNEMYNPSGELICDNSTYGTDSEKTSKPFDIMPPYYKLVYIIKAKDDEDILGYSY